MDIIITSEVSYQLHRTADTRNGASILRSILYFSFMIIEVYETVLHVNFTQK